MGKNIFPRIDFKLHLTHGVLTATNNLCTWWAYKHPLSISVSIPHPFYGENSDFNPRTHRRTYVLLAKTSFCRNTPFVGICKQGKLIHPRTFPLYEKTYLFIVMSNYLWQMGFWQLYFLDIETSIVHITFISTPLLWRKQFHAPIEEPVFCLRKYLFAELHLL